MKLNNPGPWIIVPALLVHFVILCCGFYLHRWLQASRIREEGATPKTRPMPAYQMGILLWFLDWLAPVAMFLSCASQSHWSVGHSVLVLVIIAQVAVYYQYHGVQGEYPNEVKLLAWFAQITWPILVFLSLELPYWIYQRSTFSDQEEFHYQLTVAAIFLFVLFGSLTVLAYHRHRLRMLCGPCVDDLGTVGSSTMIENHHVNIV